MDLVNSQNLQLATFFLVVGIATVSFHRLYWSPLAKYPGPKLAAWTEWYEIYWNIVQPGQFVFQLQKLHDQYGPIVRINPWELHIRDPDFFETIYEGKKDKVLSHVKWGQNGLATQSTVDHELHRLRRAPQSPFFSKRQIQLFAPYIQACADKLCGRLQDEFAGTSKPVPLGDAYACLTGDVVMEYSFARNEDFLALPTFDSPFLRAMHELQLGFHFLRYFPGILAISEFLPKFSLPPSVKTMLDFKLTIKTQILDIADGRNQGHKDVSHPTIFKELLDSKLPADEKSIRRLEDEGITIIGAGQETVKHTLTLTTYHLLKNPKLMDKLREEIITIFPNPSEPPNLTELENLPYLSAVLQEGTRLAYGVPGRLARTSSEPLIYGPYTIPPGVIISTDAYGVHTDETLFPSAHSFIPERWLNNPRAPALGTIGSSGIEEGGRLLSRYNVVFSKGTRQCVGMHLANAELVITLANVVRRCDLELYKTEWNDVGFLRDAFGPFPGPNSTGLRVLIKGGL